MASKISVPELISALIIAAAFTGAAPGIAQAQQKFPTKPVRIVVGFSAGSATDITARMVASKLSDIWGQSLVIENRTGAAGQLATVMVAKAAPDGHTLLIMSTAMVINAVLPEKPLYDLLKDFHRGHPDRDRHHRSGRHTVAGRQGGQGVDRACARAARQAPVRHVWSGQRHPHNFHEIQHGRRHQDCACGFQRVT